MIAVDAMGGDFAPQVIIEGVLRSARTGISVAFFGVQSQITPILTDLDSSWKSLPITIFDCSEVISMADEPGKAVRQKTDASLIRAMQAVRQGTAQAIVSAGNSGAALIAALIHIGKIQGLLRPAIGGFIPTLTDSVFCVDLGANVDCKAEYLVQFAVMADQYVRLVKGLKSPKIALLSNGIEVGKGNKLVQEAYELLNQEKNITFFGNCEPADIFNNGVDVVVCDGFVGNIMLKSMEATVKEVTRWLKDEGNRSLRARCAGFFC